MVRWEGALFENWAQFEAAIVAQYSRKSNEEELLGKFMLLRQTTSVKEYVSQWNELEEFATNEISERLVRIKFKVGLKEYFQKVTGRLEIDGKKLSLSDMKRIVVDEERLSTRDVTRNQTGKPRRNTATPPTSTNSDVECFYCGKKDHTKRGCRRMIADHEKKIFMSCLPEVAARRTAAVNEVTVRQGSSINKNTRLRSRVT